MRSPDLSSQWGMSFQNVLVIAAYGSPHVLSTNGVTESIYIYGFIHCAKDNGFFMRKHCFAATPSYEVLNKDTRPRTRNNQKKNSSNSSNRCTSIRGVYSCEKGVIGYLVPWDFRIKLNCDV
jgi:hypothetical protein